jgi:hypothetical protein
VKQSLPRVVIATLVVIALIVVCLPLMLVGAMCDAVTRRAIAVVERVALWVGIKV